MVLATSPHLTGATVDSGGLTVTAGGLTVSAGGASITGTVTGTTFSGSGASLTSIGTSNMTGVSGTASSTTYLRGDNTWSAISLGTSSLTGVVTVPQGGTGDTTLTAHGLLVGNGTNAVAMTAAGASGALLLGQGGSADPSFAAMSQDCTITNAGVITCTKTNNVAFGALATASSVNLATQVSGVLPIANGGTNASSQTTNGVNYYNGTSITSGNGFVYNGSSVGIGTATPTAALTVNGTSAFQFGTNYSTTGTQSDVNLGSASSVRYTGAGVATFNGISGGVNGRVLYLHNGSIQRADAGGQGERGHDLCEPDRDGDGQRPQRRGEQRGDPAIRRERDEQQRSLRRVACDRGERRLIGRNGQLCAFMEQRDDAWYLGDLPKRQQHRPRLDLAG